MTSEAVFLLRVALIDVHNKLCPNTSYHYIADCPYLHSNWSVDPLNTSILKAEPLPSSFSGKQPAHFAHTAPQTQAGPAAPQPSVFSQPSPATFSSPAEKQSASFSQTAPQIPTFSSPAAPQPSVFSQPSPATFASPAGKSPSTFSSPVATAPSPVGNANQTVFSSPFGSPAAFSFASTDKSTVNSPSPNLFNSPFTSAPATDSPFFSSPSQAAPSSNSTTLHSTPTKGGFSNKNSRSKRRSGVESVAAPAATQPESQPPKPPQVQPQVQPQQPQVQSKQPQAQPQAQPQTQPEVKPQQSQSQPQQPHSDFRTAAKIEERWAKPADPQFVGTPWDSWQEFTDAMKEADSIGRVRARNSLFDTLSQPANVPAFVHKSRVKKSVKATSSGQQAPLNSNSNSPAAPATAASAAAPAASPAAAPAAAPAATPSKPDHNSLHDSNSDLDIEEPLEVKVPKANVAKDRVFVRRQAQASVPASTSSKPAAAPAVPEVPKADVKPTPTPAQSQPQATHASASKSESKAEATPSRSNVYSDGPSVHFKERTDPIPPASSSQSRPHSAAAPSKPAQAATPSKAAAPSPSPAPASKPASPPQSRPAAASKSAPPRKSNNPKSHESLHEYYSAFSMSELQVHIRKFAVDASTVFEKADIVALVCTAHRVHEEKVAAEKAARDAEAAAVRIVKTVANWAKRLSLPAMLNELNGVQPGDDIFVPEPVKAKARSRYGRAQNLYGGGGYDYFDYEDYQEPVTVSFELIRKSYKRALLATHPDKHMHESEEKQLQATERFKALNEAFKKYESEHGR